MFDENINILIHIKHIKGRQKGQLPGAANIDRQYVQERIWIPDNL